MAYNYFPTNYQPYQHNSFVQWVQGEAAAKSFPVAPNTSVPLFDSEANIIYIKSADASGMPSIKILDYTVRENTSKTAENLQQNNFVTRDELLNIQKEIDALKSKFGDRRKEKNDGK